MINKINIPNLTGIVILLISLALSPVIASAASPVHVSAGAVHMLVLMDNGTVYGWGDASSGELGDGNTNRTDINNIAIPIRINGVSHVSQAVAGAMYSIFLIDNGTAYASGMDMEGELGINGVGGPTCLTPTKVVGLDKVSFIDANTQNTMALCDNGSVWIWGANDNGYFSNGSEKYLLIPVMVSGTPSVKSIAAGEGFVIVLGSDGTVWGLGANEQGELGDGTRVSKKSLVQMLDMTDVTAIDAGSYHTVMLKSDGTVWTCGSNMWGQQGTAGPAGTSITKPVQVPGLTDVVAISAGPNYTIVLKKDGTVWAWGLNSGGVLGIPDTTESVSSPVQIKELSDVTDISAGNFNVAAISNGKVYIWGSNVHGQLGIDPDSLGAINYSYTPVEISFDVKAVGKPINLSPVAGSTGSNVSAGAQASNSTVHYNTSLPLGDGVMSVIAFFLGLAVAGGIFVSSRRR